MSRFTEHAQATHTTSPRVMQLGIVRLLNSDESGSLSPMLAEKLRALPYSENLLLNFMYNVMIICLSFKFIIAPISLIIRSFSFCFTLVSFEVLKFYYM